MFNNFRIKLIKKKKKQSSQKVDPDSEPARRGRRSNPLKVAFAFPTRKAGAKRPASEPLPQPQVLDSDEEEENFMTKRALNVKENKEMVIKTCFVQSEVIGPVCGFFFFFDRSTLFCFSSLN